MSIRASKTNGAEEATRGKGAGVGAAGTGVGAGTYRSVLLRLCTLPALPTEAHRDNVAVRRPVHGPSHGVQDRLLQHAALGNAPHAHGLVIACRYEQILVRRVHAEAPQLVGAVAFVQQDRAFAVLRDFVDLTPLRAHENLVHGHVPHHAAHDRAVRLGRRVTHAVLLNLVQAVVPQLHTTVLATTDQALVRGIQRVHRRLVSKGYLFDLRPPEHVQVATGRARNDGATVNGSSTQNWLCLALLAEQATSDVQRAALDLPEVHVVHTPCHQRELRVPGEVHEKHLLLRSLLRRLDHAVVPRPTLCLVHGNRVVAILPNGRNLLPIRRERDTRDSTRVECG